MKYIKGMSVKETPVKAIFDGEEVELTDQQLRDLGYLPMEEAIIKQGDELMCLIPSPEEIKEEVMSGIGIVMPRGLPFKLGYRWKPILRDGLISFESVEDSDAVGTSETPIIFTENVVLVPNAYYLHELERYVYVGNPGMATTWDEVSDNMEKF